MMYIGQTTQHRNIESKAYGERGHAYAVNQQVFVQSVGVGQKKLDKLRRKVYLLL